MLSNFATNVQMSFSSYFFISICNVRPHCVKEVKQRNPFTEEALKGSFLDPTMFC